MSAGLRSDYSDCYIDVIRNALGVCPVTAAELQHTAIQCDGGLHGGRFLPESTSSVMVNVKGNVTGTVTSRIVRFPSETKCVSSVL